MLDEKDQEARNWQKLQMVPSGVPTFHRGFRGNQALPDSHRGALGTSGKPKPCEAGIASVMLASAANHISNVL